MPQAKTYEHYEECEYLAKMVELMLLQKYISKDDLLSLIKKGTSKMLNMPENKIFKTITKKKC